jgi:hypothetical protein
MDENPGLLPGFFISGKRATQRDLLANGVFHAARRTKAALAGGLCGEIIGRGDRIRTYDLYVPNA